ncbi:hypothetical protein [Microvirga subterranea]|uniref:Uncharacterized protein n=1 Tax=Microvirga subterranea TaxID=186651 RepID=A0A370HJP0_9HYPH|nr:hypothetical protein [Microvirga subterranea]RDI58570.1 hypothetical protein DES45_10593 [Microvirga subterranea]
MPVSPPVLPLAPETDELVVERSPHEPSVWLIHHRETRLVVGTAPWRSTRQLLRRSAFQHPSCYALVGKASLRPGAPPVPGTHVGRTGRPPARVRQHRNAPPLASLRAITLISIDNGRGLGLEEAAALEQALHEEVASAGSHALVSRAPRDRGLSPGVVTRVNRWLEILRWMLPVAQCLILEPESNGVGLDDGRPGDVLPAAEGMAPPIIGWTRDVPKALLHRPDVQRFRLERGGVEASAVLVDGWCILEKGSRARAGEISSIQAGLRNKRNELRKAGVLKRVRGRKDVLVATDHVGVPSLTNLTRLLLGNNAGPALWQPVT